jgi:protocatechuate 3,4-dioxygenase beta subunit
MPAPASSLAAFGAVLVLCACDTSGARDTAEHDRAHPEDTSESATPDACRWTTPLPATCVPTSPDGEGPYWRVDAPERAALNVADATGTRMFVAGRVLDSACRPVAGVRVYLWSAGPDLTYDHLAADPNLYGYQTTAPDGTVCFETLRPLPYGPPEARLPAHFHVNVLDNDVKRLTTQLRFTGDPYLGAGMDPRRIVTPEPLPDGSERVSYDFVLPP